MIRKSTLRTVVGGLVLAAISLALVGGLIGVGLLLPLERLPHEVSRVISGILVALGIGLMLLLGVGVIAYAVLWGHPSWRVNRARYPGLKAAIERYREPGEGVRRVMPAFVVDGRRYFLVKYGRKFREWEPGKPQTGMLVLDEHGRVQNDETLFRRLHRAIRHVEETYLHDSLLAQEEAMAAGPRMERAAAEFRAFFSRVLRSAGQPEVIHHIDAFLTPLVELFQRIAAVIEGEYHWCQKNRKRVEFTLEEMQPLWKARDEFHNKYGFEKAVELGRAWAKLEELRPTLESLPGLTRHDRAHMRKLLDALRVTAEAAAEWDRVTMQLPPERIEPYRSRTAKALRLEGQGQAEANAQ